MLGRAQIHRVQNHAGNAKAQVRYGVFHGEVQRIAQYGRALHKAETQREHHQLQRGAKERTRGRFPA